MITLAVIDPVLLTSKFVISIAVGDKVAPLADTPVSADPSPINFDPDATVIVPACISPRNLTVVVP